MRAFMLRSRSGRHTICAASTRRSSTSSRTLWRGAGAPRSGPRGAATPNRAATRGCRRGCRIPRRPGRAARRRLRLRSPGCAARPHARRRRTRPGWTGPRARASAGDERTAPARHRGRSHPGGAGRRVELDGEKAGLRRQGGVLPGPGAVEADRRGRSGGGEEQAGEQRERSQAERRGGVHVQGFLGEAGAESPKR